MRYLYTLLFLASFLYACKKDFLDVKPSTSIVSPNTLADCQALLENVDILNRATPALLQMASDDYVFIDDAAWFGTLLNAERNSYIWAKDLYEGQKDIKDWNAGFSSIFICNNVLEALEQIPVNATNQKEWNNIKGWAHFMRAYSMYDLARSFSPAYDERTAATDLGIPVRLNAGIDVKVARSNLSNTYNQIFADLATANLLLQANVDLNFKERPSKVAVMALSTRIYLSMRNYEKAEAYADSTLNLYHTLIDYNTVDISEPVPFSMNNAETILNTTVVSNYYKVVATAAYNDAVTINPELYISYEDNDLRKSIYFTTNPLTGRLYIKFGYQGANTSPFTGLATDEIYLIKAECLARRNDINQAMSVLSLLLKNRYRTNTFSQLSANSSADALDKVLLERRKELIWRSLRWTDLKRFNIENRGITLKRMIDGRMYTLPPNDKKYVFPIPDDEIALSGIRQNDR